MINSVSLYLFLLVWRLDPRSAEVTIGSIGSETKQYNILITNHCIPSPRNPHLTQ